MTKMPSLILLAGLLLLGYPISSVTAEEYAVSPDGSPYSIEEAMDRAGPGDTVTLADGVYTTPIVTTKAGEEKHPITIRGGTGAIISGEQDDKVVTVLHSWVHLEGFTVDGEISSDDSRDSYVGKCVYVWGQEDPKAVSFSGGEALASIIGFSMRGLTVQNCGGECVRLKHFVTNSFVTDNVITNCGIFDYEYDNGGKNGEAVYVGTSSKQWTDGPDLTAHNVVSGNVMTPNGNECVDVKEGAYGNTIEKNECREQLDENSGCYSSRGDDNTFRYNSGENCVGAGIRLGGWEVDGNTYGQHCDVYGNKFTNTGTGVIVARQLPQGVVCGNTCSDGVCHVVGDDEVEATWDQPCSSVQGGQGFDSGDDEVKEGGDSGDERRDEDSREDAEENAAGGGNGDGDDYENEENDGGAYGDEDLEGDDERDGEYGDRSEGGEVGLLGQGQGQGNEREGEGEGEGDDWERDSPSSTGCRPVQILSTYLTGGPSTQPENPVDHLIDGSLDTRWSAEGPGSWMAIDLPGATSLSGMEASFEDGDRRTQKFDIVVLGENEVTTMVHSSSGTTNEAQLFSFGGDVKAKSVFVVGYGNSVTPWNSFTVINLCEGGGDGSGDRRERRQLAVSAAPEHHPASTTTTAATTRRTRTTTTLVGSAQRQHKQKTKMTIHHRNRINLRGSSRV